MAQTLTNTSTKGSASTVMEKKLEDVLNINDHTWHKSKTTNSDQLLLLFNLRMRFSLPIKALTFSNEKAHECGLHQVRRVCVGH